jgi:carboxyl-terminal processing protease
MQTLFRQLPTLFTGTLLGALVALGGNVVLAEREESTPAIPYEELRTFTEVFQRIKSDYVEEVEDKTLLDSAIQGMLAGLDPHSSYLTPEAYQELTISTGGEFGGLGIEVGMDNGFVKVIAPIDDTPAQRAGVKAGDLIIRLDDTPVKGMTLNDAVKVMRGKPGSRIKLTIVRENEDKPLTIEIVRDIIQVKSVKFRTLEPGYGYIRISHFQAHTMDDLSKAIDDLKNDNKKGLKGVVLDLRNNPGGVLNAAVSVSDAFLKEGLIVYTEGRVADASLKFDAKPDDLINGASMVVLVNNGSASAAEIVAGALQDHKRAVIMGTKTFGKGSVQTILPMNNNAALKLTTARYFTPNGRSIQAKGIEPDIKLSKVEIAAVEPEEDSGFKEADLARHLDNPKKDNAKKVDEKKGSGSGKKSSDNKADKADKADKVDKKEKEDEPLVKSDYALYEALNLLKGLSIVGKDS